MAELQIEVLLRLGTVFAGWQVKSSGDPSRFSCDCLKTGRRARACLSMVLWRSSLVYACRMLTWNTSVLAAARDSPTVSTGDVNTGDREASLQRNPAQRGSRKSLMQSGVSRQVDTESLIEVSVLCSLAHSHSSSVTSCSPGALT